MVDMGIFRHKLFRDPLYGFVGLSKKEVKLVDTKVFRRLHRIKQLSHAYLVYPSALHTRFEHSIGVAHIAGRMCDELKIDTEKEIIRQAALLHDIGHGPFSHLFENVLKKINPGIGSIHEEITKLMIQDDSEICGILGPDREEVVKILDSKTREKKLKHSTLHSDIVSGNLDADKMDYLRRDSYFLGVHYGMFDLERIIHTLRPTPDTYPALGIDSKGKDVIESYRLARHLMHTQVYEHHTRIAADQMFLQALDIAIHDEGIIDPDTLKLTSSEFLGYYKKMDDASIYELIAKNPVAKKSKDMLNKIRHRRLLKRACQFTGADIDPGTRKYLFQAEQSDLDDIAKKVADALKIPSHEIIFYRSKISLKLYNKDDILLVMGNKTHGLGQVSPISAKDTVVMFYVFGPPKVNLGKICCLVADELDVDSKEICNFK